MGGSSESNQAKAVISVDGKSLELPVITGSLGERAIDISPLRDKTGIITLDEGYGNTGSCTSAITFIDGDKGILRYRGIPIEEVAEHSTFVETAYLLIYGHLPTSDELEAFSRRLQDNARLDESMRVQFSAFPRAAAPMAILSAMMHSSGCFTPELLKPDKPELLDTLMARILSQVRTIAAFSFRHSQGWPMEYPNPEYRYTENFLHMMFSLPYQPYHLRPELVQALDLFFLLHADHEQNCSTSTARMVGSSGANLYASVSAAVCALSGPLHGGANVDVIRMLEGIHASGDNGSQFIEAAKKKDGGKRLSGFGHRVYKNFDPRAQIIKKKADSLLAKLNRKDPLLDIARHLEERALSDSYFIERKLYPNVDFYSGIILRAAGIPTDMFTVMFAIGRMPGWIAQHKEMVASKPKISRPRQIYTGEPLAHYVPIEKR